MLVRTLFFDVNQTLLDLSALRDRIAPLLGGRDDLLGQWFTTALHFSLVETVTGQNRPFGDVLTAALTEIARKEGIDLDEDRAGRVVPDAMRSLPAHDDVAPALGRLADDGYSLVAFSNSAATDLAAQLEYAGIAGCFDHVLSVEGAGVFKPDLRAYRWALGTAGADVAASAMVAAHGWDVTGAKRAKMKGIFLRRGGATPYPLGATPDLVLRDLGELPDRLTRTAVAD